MRTRRRAAVPARRRTLPAPGPCLAARERGQLLRAVVFDEERTRRGPPEPVLERGLPRVDLDEAGLLKLGASRGRGRHGAGSRSADRPAAPRSPSGRGLPRGRVERRLRRPRPILRPHDEREGATGPEDAAQARQRRGAVRDKVQRERRDHGVDRGGRQAGRVRVDDAALDQRETFPLRLRQAGGGRLPRKRPACLPRCPTPSRGPAASAARPPAPGSRTRSPRRGDGTSERPRRSVRSRRARRIAAGARTGAQNRSYRRAR